MDNSDENLQKALIKSLERKGVIGEVKARLRAEIFHAMDDCTGMRNTTNINKSQDNAVINELIREYLLFHNFKYAASVFESEAGLPAVPMEREFLANEVTDDVSQNAPILETVIKRNMENRFNNR